MLEQIFPPSFATHDENVRWSWIRAVEWGMLPVFISSPIVPVLFAFLDWYFVIAMVLLASIPWLFVRYKFVSIPLASVGAGFVTFTKWPVLLVMVLYFVFTSNYWLAVLSLAWTLFSGVLEAIFGTDVWTIQKMFLKELGVENIGGEEFPQHNSKAMDIFPKEGEHEDADTLFQRGVAYAFGRGVPQDSSEAVKWYRMAANSGLAKAQYNLGFAYTEGQGVPQDYAEGVKWYRKAAEQGNVGAQSMLGLHYYDGKGVPQDYVLAYFWTSLSASKSTGDDYNKIVEYRDEAAKKLTPEQLLKAQQMTRDWEEKHPRK